jgi:electron transport complex protein RnfE
MRRDFIRGIFKENPVLVLLLGLCPTLAVTVSVENAIGMGLASTFVLVCSNTIIATFGRFFPKRIRIPCFIVVIATFVTMVEMVMGAYLPALNESLGIFIPLIVVNCIILGRAEAFASRHGVGRSILDGVGMGIGFGAALVLISAIREVLGSGKFLGITITNYYSPAAKVQPAAAMIMAPGAFIVIALILGFINWRKQKAA